MTFTIIFENHSGFKIIIHLLLRVFCFSVFNELPFPLGNGRHFLVLQVPLTFLNGLFFGLLSSLFGHHLTLPSGDLTTVRVLKRDLKTQTKRFESKLEILYSSEESLFKSDSSES